ncbi:MAG: hypothetical protein E7K47_17475, partial [Acidovorax sp.]|nr:hypothetical protein [Acidovorax sp.]
MHHTTIGNCSHLLAIGKQTAGHTSHCRAIVHPRRAHRAAPHYKTISPKGTAMTVLRHSRLIATAALLTGALALGG